MLSSIISASVFGLSCLSVVSGAPFTYSNDPLGNGFPNVKANTEQLTTLETQARGALSNSPPPPMAPSADSLKSLRLIAFNELTEVAFFTELLTNLTTNVHGFEIGHHGARDYIIKALAAIQAQEEIHAINANNALARFDTPILPCQYQFPVSNFEDAINLANTFTDVVLGTLQDVQEYFGKAGDIGLIRGVGSVIGQEGEQNGFYRQLLDKIPSALPFLTTGTREFAFSALQGLVVEGTCGNLDAVGLQIFQPLTITSPKVNADTQKISFSFESSDDQPSWNSDYSGLSVVYINQQSLPVVEPLIDARKSNSVVTFDALFPFDFKTNGALFGNGLTLALVTNSTQGLTSATAVANVTVFGPGLIEIN